MPNVKSLKEVHTSYCNYEIAKVNKPSRIYTVREPKREIKIRTSGLSQAMLAQQLASLF